MGQHLKKKPEDLGTAYPTTRDMGCISNDLDTTPAWARGWMGDWFTSIHWWSFKAGRNFLAMKKMYFPPKSTDATPKWTDQLPSIIFFCETY